MKVLVTGATGFTGSALVRRLLDEGHRVVGLDTQKGLFFDELTRRGADITLGSVTDQDTVERLMDGVDVVHHVAAAFRQLDVGRDVYDDVNIDGTRVVADAAHRAGVRKLIYCSTCGVHGNVEYPPANEDAPIAPADYYQRTKYEGERIIEEYTARGLKTLILRPAGIYGPGDPERFYMIFRRVARGWFPMFGDGQTLYHSVYIDNLVDAFMLAMESERGDGRAYLVADERHCTIEELVRRVAEAMDVPVRFRRLPLTPLLVAGHIVEKACLPFGIAPPIFPRRVDWYRQDRAFDITRARRELGYEPKVPLAVGLRRTARWYRENGML
ncbi:MAG TPA: NAD(P)-dependent oxidoreductase [Longimicrobiales bacterium]